jgi:excisionase family DNA binding protein
MSETITNCGSKGLGDALPVQLGNRMSVEEIARRLHVGRLAVYSMLDQGILPGIRLGRRWIITRHAYEEWERTCGTRAGAGLPTQPEVTVLN